MANKFMAFGALASMVFSLLALLELRRFTSELSGLMYQVDVISDKLRALQANLKSYYELRATSAREPRA